MISVTMQFQTVEEMLSAISGAQARRAVVATEVNEPDAKLAAAAPAEVIVKKMDAPGPDLKRTKPAPKTAPPAKKAAKGTAQKKNEAQARAAAKAKAAEQEAEVSPTAAPEVSASETSSKVDVAAVQKALRAYAQQYQLPGARALLAKFGVSKASELKEEQYASFVMAASQAPVTEEA